MRKLSTFLVLFGIISFLICLQAQSVSLEIKKSDASIQKIGLATVNKLSFSNSNLVINLKDGSTENIALNDIRNIIFGTISGINKINNIETELALYPNPATDFIKFKNLKSRNSKLSIMSINGIVLLNKTLTSESEMVDISQLTKGMYIVKVNNQALKFNKL